MLKHLADGQNRTYVTMARILAQSDPVLFFQTYKPPIIIDEIQKAPKLFEQIKVMCDDGEERELFWLTGSGSICMCYSQKKKDGVTVQIVVYILASRTPDEGPECNTLSELLQDGDKPAISPFLYLAFIHCYFIRKLNILPVRC